MLLPCFDGIWRPSDDLDGPSAYSLTVDPDKFGDGLMAHTHSFKVCANEISIRYSRTDTSVGCLNVAFDRITFQSGEAWVRIADTPQASAHMHSQRIKLLKQFGVTPSPAAAPTATEATATQAATVARKRRVSPPQVPPVRLVPAWHKVRRGVWGEKHPTETAGNAEVASPLAAAAAAVTAAATAAAPAPAPALIPTPPGLTTVSDCSHLADTRAGSTSARTEQQDEADWRIAHDLLETLSNHADNENSAAQELLNIIFSCKDSRAIKSKQEVLDLVAEPIRRREAYIHKLAIIRGVPQPAPGQYTMQQWKWWLSSRPLDKEDMEGAVHEWKKDFENAEFRQQEQVAEWRQEDTRESKQRATQLINGAWKSELSKRYGRFQLALAFVKHPTATVDTLLESWSMYMRSPEYRRQRERSHLTRSSEVVNKADKLKLNVQALRRQNRRAANLHKLLEHGYIQSVPSGDQDMYQRWVTGRLAKDVNEATSLHGYGKLSSGKYLTAPKLDDFMGTF